MRVKVKKIEHYNLETKPTKYHIAGVFEGDVFVGDVDESSFIAPTVGKRFELRGHLITSPVTAIISATKFRTMNSVYYWKILKL